MSSNQHKTQRKLVSDVYLRKLVFVFGNNLGFMQVSDVIYILNLILFSSKFNTFFMNQTAALRNAYFFKPPPPLLRNAFFS